MADISIIQSTQFVINELSVATKIPSTPTIDLRFIYEELNIFDSIFNPCMSGSIVIRDAIGLSEKMMFDGSEVLKIRISKAIDSDVAMFEKSFRIYKQNNRTNVNMSSEVYTLHFISEEFIFSEQQYISQAYTTQYSVAAKQIMDNQLAIPKSNIGIIESTTGLKKFIIPMLKPIEALEWLSRRSVDDKGSPNYIFFENKEGFNFTRLSTLQTRMSVGQINFNPKNISDNVADELWGARYVKVLSQYDFIQNTRAGVYSSRFIGFDNVTRSIGQLDVQNLDTYNNMSHGNKTQNISVVKNRANKTNIEMQESKVTYLPYSSARASVDYIKENDPVSLQQEDDTYRYVMQRQAIFQSLLGQRMQIVLPGNFNISSGFMVDVMMPTRSERETGQSSQDALDKTLYGKYMIIAARHIIKQDKHEVVFEVATDSTNKDAVYSSTDNQKL